LSRFQTYGTRATRCIFIPAPKVESSNSTDPSFRWWPARNPHLRPASHHSFLGNLYIFTSIHIARSLRNEQLRYCTFSGCDLKATVRYFWRPRGQVERLHLPKDVFKDICPVISLIIPLLVRSLLSLTWLARIRKFGASIEQRMGHSTFHGRALSRCPVQPQKDG
jgi:hypothetical protein